MLGNRFGRSDEVLLVADAAPLPFLSIAAHGHADCLSFVLSLGGVQVLVDPGTYCYHSDPKWREYFKGTSAHNTVRVDGVVMARVDLARSLSTDRRIAFVADWPEAGDHTIEVVVDDAHAGRVTVDAFIVLE